jgi:hypothetical protein
VRKILIVSALILGSAAALAADEGRPHWLVNADLLGGSDLAPSTDSGDSLFGGRAGIEYLLPTSSKSQILGVDLDYNCLSVGKSPDTGTDNDLSLSLHFLPVTYGMTSVGVQVGAGYNTTPNTFNGHYMGFIEPGVRIAVLPRLAVDAALQYLASTPSSKMVGSLGLIAGVSVPLDGTFKSAEKPSPVPTPVPTMAPAPLSATAAVAGGAQGLSPTAHTKKHKPKKKAVAGSAMSLTPGSGVATSGTSSGK